MEQGKINCPNCGYKFEISDVLAGQFRDKLKAELQKEVVQCETALQNKLDRFKFEREALAIKNSQLEAEVEQQINRVVKNTVGLYGNMQGIIGCQIPVIPALELDEPDLLMAVAAVGDDQEKQGLNENITEISEWRHCRANAD